MYIDVNNKRIKVLMYSKAWNKFWGLMFRKDIINKGYYFYKCNNIHTFFMKQNIDVCMIDNSNRIVLLRENVPKNRIIICLKAKHTLELPLGTCKYLRINEHLKIGD